MIDEKISKTIVFVLVPNFSMIAFGNALEPLRLANRSLGYEAYKWRIVSLSQENTVASNNVQLQADLSLFDERDAVRAGARPDLTLVCTGIYVERFSNKTLNSHLRMLHKHGMSVGALCTGAWVLADAQLLTDRRCAIHWENLPSFSELYPDAEVYADLFEIDDKIYTCAGGTAALDMMLHIIGEDHGEALVNRICEQCLTDRIRESSDRQRLPLSARLGVFNAKLLNIIEMMEANIAEPLPLLEIADHAGLSRRQIERLFRRNLGRSPARYYLELRLERARNLLLRSNIPVVEIAVACGFVSASHFSKCYREMFGRSPQADRNERASMATASTSTPASA